MEIQYLYPVYDYYFSIDESSLVGKRLLHNNGLIIEATRVVNSCILLKIEVEILDRDIECSYLNP